jgi:putative acetyltransferase
MPGTIKIRIIEQRDNQTLALIIRNTLAEFGANKPGTVYFDPTTDNLYGLFQKPRSVYFVVLKENKIIGGGGIYPTEGLPEHTCELVKMYLLPEARGIGLGRSLIEKCIVFAKEAGYKNVYLETMPELKNALKVYEKLGFKYLNGPIGNSGHFGCDLWMIASIEGTSGNDEHYAINC